MSENAQLDPAPFVIIKVMFQAAFVSELHHCAGDRELIQEVLFDAVVTAPLAAYWTGLALNKSEYAHLLLFPKLYLSYLFSYTSYMNC